MKFIKRIRAAVWDWLFSQELAAWLEIHHELFGEAIRRTNRRLEESEEKLAAMKCNREEQITALSARVEKRIQEIEQTLRHRALAVTHDWNRLIELEDAVTTLAQRLEQLAELVIKDPAKLNDLPIGETGPRALLGLVAPHDPHVFALPATPVYHDQAPDRPATRPVHYPETDSDPR